jgi:type II secretory pathway predicted ATPase ExeA
MRFGIPAMDLAESGAYLAHHLKLAGRRDPVFAEDSVPRLHRFARGVPRALQRRHRPLVAAAAAGKALVDDACAKASARAPGYFRPSITATDSMVERDFWSSASLEAFA